MPLEEDMKKAARRGKSKTSSTSAGDILFCPEALQKRARSYKKGRPE